MNASTSIWKSGDFRYLFIGQTCAQLASQVAFLAVPLVATITLDATPAQMAVITALGGVPPLVAGLHTGALVDRHRRRPAMIGADVVRALLLATIPLAWFLDMLSLPLLAIVVLVSGLMTLVFDVAYQAFLANVLDRNRLVEGNSALEMSRTASELVGPGVAGQLVHVLGAPLTMLANAGLYGVSALCITCIDVTRDPKPASAADGHSLWNEIVVGLRAVWMSRPLRVMVLGRGTLAFCNAALEVVFVLFVVRELDVGPAMLGLIFSIGGIGFLAGSFASRFIDRRVGFGIGSALAVMLIALGDLLVPAADAVPMLVIPLLILAEILFGIGMTVFNVNQASLRQVSVPVALQGRASATARFIGDAAVPAGAVAGGVLGEVFGLQATLYIAVAGEFVVAVWLLASPLRRLHRLPQVDHGLT